MASHTHRLDVRTRAKALQAGSWQSADGTFVALRRMPVEHLVNAVLKALTDGEPASITEPLAAEVIRRGIASYALGVAAARMRQEGRTA